MKYIGLEAATDADGCDSKLEKYEVTLPRWVDRTNPRRRGQER